MNCWESAYSRGEAENPSALPRTVYRVVSPGIKEALVERLISFEFNAENICSRPTEWPG
jgi:hypothetical protein